MRYLIIIIILLFIIGCTSHGNTTKKEYIEERLESTIYLKDTRPNPPLCYLRTPQYGSWGYSNVPCENVEHLLK